MQGQIASSRSFMEQPSIQNVDLVNSETLLVFFTDGKAALMSAQNLYRTAVQTKELCRDESVEMSYQRDIG